MDAKTDRESHDFMNVESFSQFPYTTHPSKEKRIRLFGKDFGTVRGGADAEKTTESGSGETNPSEAIKDQENGESNRKFECQYCCRNFPTSQALGGHQNAHKRERQHAKRAHLQSSITVHNSVSDSNLYGCMTYSPQTMTYHPSWNNSATSRFYGASSLGLRRHIPSATQSSVTFGRERSLQTIPWHVKDELKRSQVGGSSAQSRYAYESMNNLQDHASRGKYKIANLCGPESRCNRSL